jgi:hypothetical protein
MGVSNMNSRAVITVQNLMRNLIELHEQLTYECRHEQAAGVHKVMELVTKLPYREVSEIACKHIPSSEYAGVPDKILEISKLYIMDEFKNYIFENNLVQFKDYYSPFGIGLEGRAYILGDVKRSEEKPILGVVNREPIGI